LFFPTIFLTISISFVPSKRKPFSSIVSVNK
jgi:hypothetical protein